MKLAGAVLLCVALAGCALTDGERQLIIDSASAQAASVAEAAAYRKVYDALIAQGKTAEEAKALAAEAAQVAGAAAGAVAAKAAAVGADKLADEKGAKTNGWIAALLPGILALFGAAAKKAVGA